METTHQFHRVCKECNLHVEEGTIMKLAEHTRMDYNTDMNPSCPKCECSLVQKFGDIPDNVTNVYDPFRRNLGQDINRDDIEKMLG